MTSLKTYLGIDGGGTRTRLALVSEQGTLLGLVEGGSCSFADLGMEPARAELARLGREVWRRANQEPQPADALFMGMGSILSSEDARINCDLAVGIGLAQPGAVRADNDAWNAHFGALAGRPGILLIAGTGSACLGRNAAGESWRAGGWGHLLGETGCAYALGQTALIAATRAADGRGPATTLTEAVQAALNLRDLKEIYRKVHHVGVPRGAVAALAPSVVKLAEAGDAVAQEILRQGADGLVEMVGTVAGRLRLAAPELALTGGLIDNAASFRKLFLERLALALSEVRLVSDGLAPVFGAVLLAVQADTGAPPSGHFLEKLRASSDGRVESL